MKDVKKEIYGSRKSNLLRIFEDNNIKFIRSLWFVTCRQSINWDVNTRYLVFLEGCQKINLSIFSDYINVYNVVFADNGVLAKNLRTNDKKIFSFEEFKNWIIKKTNCEFIESKAPGSSEASALSIFFRENMGKGFALSDVDFFITNKSILLEEKTFIKNNYGFLGEGQYLTFKEINNDICPNIDFHIVLNDGENFYIVELKSINPNRINNETEWGAMIEFDLGNKYSIDDIIEKYK